MVSCTLTLPTWKKSRGYALSNCIYTISSPNINARTNLRTRGVPDCKNSTKRQGEKRYGYLDGARDLEVCAAVGDLDAGGVGAGLGGGDAAALGDRLLGVEVHRVDDLPLLDAAPQVGAAAAAAGVHLRATRVGEGADPGARSKER